MKIHSRDLTREQRTLAKSKGRVSVRILTEMRELGFPDFSDRLKSACRSDKIHFRLDLQRYRIENTEEEYSSGEHKQMVTLLDEFFSKV